MISLKNKKTIFFKKIVFLYPAFCLSLLYSNIGYCITLEEIIDLSYKLLNNMILSPYQVNLLSQTPTQELHKCIDEHNEETQKFFPGFKHPQEFASWCLEINDNNINDKLAEYDIIDDTQDRRLRKKTYRAAPQPPCNPTFSSMVYKRDPKASMDHQNVLTTPTAPTHPTNNVKNIFTNTKFRDFY